MEQFFWICLVVVWLFPTCQVRVVRFYKSCPFLLLLLLVLLFASFSPSSSPASSAALCCRAQRAAPDLNCKLQSALGITGPRQGAPKGQRRTSTGELLSGVRSAGPRPGSICQKECQKKRQKICQKKCQ